MTDADGLSRRQLVGLATGAAGTALAGCLGSDGGDADLSTEAWDDVETIRLTGHQVEGWTGVEPAAIEDVVNPTLVLFAGREYDLTWENLDGASHNVQLRDGDGGSVEKTSRMNEKGATQTLTFEASDVLASYRCVPHPGSMAGSLEVRSE